MKCLITGINGFVGSYLVEELITRNYIVAGMYIDDDFTKLNKNLRIKLYKADLSEKNKLNKIVYDFKPDYIFHLAAISSVEFSFKNPELTYKVNVDGTENILKSVINAKIDPIILIISSANIYGIPKTIPIKETHPLNPQNPYAISKLKAEKLALNYFSKYNLKVICVRSFNHFGPRQSLGFVCSDLTKQIAEIKKGLKEPILYVGNLEAKRDFTDVRDIVKAYVLAVKKCKAGEVYNICSGRSYSIKEIIDVLLSFSNIKIKIKQDPNKLRPSDIPISVGNNTKFCRATGWKPKIEFKQTLKDLLDYWRKNV